MCLEDTSKYRCSARNSTLAASFEPYEALNRTKSALLGRFYDWLRAHDRSYECPSPRGGPVV